MKVSICPQAFNPWQAIQDYQQGLKPDVKFGATSIFIGTMRDYNDGASVSSMILEYYPGMTEKQLEKIIVQAGQQWQILDAYISHRVGKIQPDETIVLVAVWAAHRGDAFDACRFMMEALKSTAPFWKNETLASGESRWVVGNSGGYQGDY